jgi:hypothetical protein
MKLQKSRKFSEKHDPDAAPDDSIKTEILKQPKTGEIPCAAAFQIAETLKVSPNAVGKAADLMNFKLTECQLGLFGYRPRKKIVEPHCDIKADVKDAISQSLVRGRLSCERAWKIASRFNIGKMAVSSACEAMGIKIKDCQLGAF